MKAIIIKNNYLKASPPLGWYFLADSAVTNTGKPFYLPENVGRVCVALGCCLRISRLGKGIQKKFAGRYFQEAAPALHFYLPEYEEKLKNEGLPADAARSFDRSLFVGDFSPFNIEDNYELTVNGTLASSLTLRNCIFPIAETIHDVSRLNTLKMGDLLVPALADGVVVNEDDIFTVIKNGMPEFKVKIK